MQRLRLQNASKSTSLTKNPEQVTQTHTASDLLGDDPNGKEPTRKKLDIKQP